jgi:hypothetical protein
MEPGPSQVAEIIAGWLLPPACREEILGDMRERYHSNLGYFIDALQVIPCVIYSRICRTTDCVLALMEGGALYTAFMVVAKAFAPGLILQRSGLLRLAIPPLIVLAAMSLADAYGLPQRRWVLKPLLAPMTGFAVACLVQWMCRHWSLPAPVFAWGSAAGLLLVSTIRLAFPSPAGRPQTVNAPAFWQKLELAPLPKSAFVPGVILLAVILYLLAK